MPEVFNDYAKYYDLLYKDKNYDEEANYIHGLLQKHKAGTKTVLNLGCGTGKHDACLQRLGYQVCGVDRSETMLAEAAKYTIFGELEFFHGDVRNVNLGKTFDAVISVFHVMSYQVTDDDILSAFTSAYRHLKDGGVFVFDFWHGEGVASDPPAVRVKCLEDDTVKIIRTANPVMHPDRHVIDVNYRIALMNKRSGRRSELRETHVMRYFFLAELKQFLLQTGFEVNEGFEWMSNRPLGSAWYGLLVANKKGGNRCVLG